MQLNIHLSKFLSLVLRHQPEKIGLQLDANGWADVASLIEKMREAGFQIDFQRLAEIVNADNKQRYRFSEDLKKIRANQGHSIRVDLQFTPQTPPEVLFHGTAERFLISIEKEGLKKGSRHHVHLSPDEATAIRVGSRHGKPVVLEISAGAMHRAGYSFFQSENGVWLVEMVPVGFLKRKDS